MIVGFEYDEKLSGDLLFLIGKVEMWLLWLIRVKFCMGFLFFIEKVKLWLLRLKFEWGVKFGVGLLLLLFLGLGVVFGIKLGCIVFGSLEMVW